MGTTLDAMGTDAGVRLGWVLVIQGYDQLITSHPNPSGISDVGWSGISGFSDAVSGLSVAGNTFRQSIHPWRVKLEPNSMTFEVMNDDLGAAMFKVGGGNETEMTDEVDANDTTINVVSTSDFAGSGRIFVGTERITYASTSATSFNSVSRGRSHPFSVDGGTAHVFGQDHAYISLGDGVYFRPKVSDEARTWKGRWVGLWAHRITGTQTWDAKSEAQLVFAGKIVDYEDTENGLVKIYCKDILDHIKNTTLLHDQWRAVLDEGVFLEAGLSFMASEGYGTTFDKTNILDVVASGATAPNEINEGRYTAGEIRDFLNDWLASETAAGRLTGGWALSNPNTNGGIRTRLTVSGVNANQWSAKLYGPLKALRFLGYDPSTVEQLDGETYYRILVTGVGTTTDFNQTSPNAPRAIGLTNEDWSEYTVTVDNVFGTFIDQTSSLPGSWQQWIGSGETWGVVQIGSGALALAKQVSATKYTLYQRKAVTEALGGDAGDGLANIEEGQGGKIEFKQVVVMEKDLKTAFLELLASTGTSAYNHATYDTLPAQLGAAIPWEILSDSLEDDLDAIQQDGVQYLLIVLDKPTKLEDVILPELLLRNAHLLWKNGALRLVQPSSPVASLASHTFTENNKAGGPTDKLRSAAQVTDEFLVNLVKIAYNRSTITGEFLATKTVKFARSISDHGESKPFTINARNSYGQFATTGSTVENAAAHLIGETLPLYGEPLLRVRRTISHNFFENVAPGDLCTISDDKIRDPETGTRGLTGKPGLIIAHRFSWGGDGQAQFGEVDILLLPQDNVTTYSPSAMVDDTATNAGYEADTDIDGNFSSGVARITFYAHEYSESSESVDVSNFDAGDSVSIVEIDDDGGSAQIWEPTINEIDSANNRAEIDQNLTGFDTTGDTRYAMESTAYTGAAATQKTHAFIADDADLQIQDSRVSYVFGRHTNSTFSTVASTELYAKTGDNSVYAFGAEGQPFTVENHRNAARFCNNMIDYGTAFQNPFQMDVGGNGYITGGSNDAGTWILTTPYFFGRSNLPAGVTRDIEVRAITALHSNGGGSFRVYLSMFPPSGDSTTTWSFVSPFNYVTFSATAASPTLQAAQTLTNSGWWRNGYGWLTIIGFGDTDITTDVGRLYSLKFTQGPRT